MGKYAEHRLWDQVQAIHRRGWTGRGVSIGHLDSGVDGDHPAIHGRVAEFLYFGDNGFAEPGRQCFDQADHGTLTAGLMCGDFGSSEGGCGVAPGARLYSAGVIDTGHVVARILGGLDWICDRPVNVLAMPFGISAETPVFSTLIDAVRVCGILPIVAVGNDGAGRCRSPGDYTQVLSVGAADADGNAAGFSGSSKIVDERTDVRPDLLAPGVDIISAARSGGVRTQSGTSMACAFVAGVAALLFEACPDACTERIEDALKKTALPLPDGRQHRCRYGLVQPLAALDHILTDESTRLPRPASDLARQFRDPRLLRQCDHADAGQWVEAALLFHDGEQAYEATTTDSRFIEDVVAEACGNGIRPPERVHTLRWGNVAIARAEVPALNALMAHPAVLVASSVSVDLIRL